MHRTIDRARGLANHSTFVGETIQNVWQWQMLFLTPIVIVIVIDCKKTTRLRHLCLRRRGLKGGYNYLIHVETTAFHKLFLWACFIKMTNWLVESANEVGITNDIFFSQKVKFMFLKFNFYIEIRFNFMSVERDARIIFWTWYNNIISIS